MPARVKLEGAMIDKHRLAAVIQSFIYNQNLDMYVQPNVWSAVDVLDTMLRQHSQPQKSQYNLSGSLLSY
jgi:hypothetical protein